MSNMILDGLTRRAHFTLPKVGGVRLDFEYRPMTATQTDQYFQANERAKGSAKTQLLAVILARQIVEWSEVDKDGKPVPITAIKVGDLPYPAQQRLLNIFTGYDVGDIDEAAPTEEGATENLNDLVAMVESNTPGIKVAEEELGN